MARLVLLVAALLLASIGAAVEWRRDSPRAAAHAADAAAGHGQHQAAEREVVVATEPELGGTDGVLTVGYERGVMPPAQATDAVVTSDENCAPDAQGVSHCRNELRMADGTSVRVQHDHRMHEVPCLVPGEHVQLRAA